MQKYARNMHNMHEYAVAPEPLHLFALYAKICKIRKICKHEMQKCKKCNPTLLMSVSDTIYDCPGLPSLRDLGDPGSNPACRPR